VKNNFYFIKQFSNIYKKTSKDSEVISQILYGEKFSILSKNKGWLKIKTSFDNYIGYIENKNYVTNYNSSHKVYVLKASIFDKANKKTKSFLSFGSKISKIRENKNFIEYEKNKWIKKKDLKNINHNEKSYVKLFKLFLKTKYVWGGKTFNGIDCSALLQLFYYYNKKFYPRDTNKQVKYSKKINRKMFKKGDIIFWKGHVAICINSKQLIHAYGPKKRVLIMPIIQTIRRIERTAKLKVIKISSIKY
jgi:cell wall-associated NlpC family hydrolase